MKIPAAFSGAEVSEHQTTVYSLVGLTHCEWLAHSVVGDGIAALCVSLTSGVKL